jgi:hypothetical protein
MALQDKLKDSKLSLAGNGFDPQLKAPSWGYKNPTVDPATLNPLDPLLSGLQNTYDVNSKPSVSVVNFNKSPYPNYLPVESKLDELDTNPLTPKNTRAGEKGSVVSQIYKSAAGKKYKDLGPKDGRYTTS